ncbi:divisome protein SepX/GlpR [Nocardia pseudovaccinii]|uniref:divisome protein SepX/GlpR n=1 Tax=Nocardia pseudovaccinii TaxID=189540 RepID=UPI0007A3B2CE|nr:gephyrin-like molybdotransferase receptor GlpR [Nocardia pseudovaccinii]
MPNSILWIGLVVLWVFVLFPILADRHPRIRQTTDAALATRVLHRGGSKRRTKSGPAAGHDSDPDYRPTRVQRKLSHSDDAEDRMTPPADEQVTEDDNPADSPPEAESAVSDAEIDDTDDEFDGADSEFDDEAEELDTADSDDAEIATARTAAKQPATADDDRVALEHTESTGARIPPARTAAPARFDESDSDDSDFVPTRRGRGGFDPEADAIARAARYTFRQRAVLGLVLAALAFGGLSVALSPMFWWGCGGSALVLVTYLAYLRKQVRMEEEIRRRRLARLARSRGEHIEAEREAEQRAQQRVMDRDTARALRRRSALIEVDDEDPTFDHLETFDPATARALRRGTGDMRRAAGA